MSAPMKILIVDDDEDIINILLVALNNYEIHTAKNGKEAVEKYFKIKPDLVLMDIMMPEKDGIQAAREIILSDKKAKIIGLTAFSSEKGKEMLQVGAEEIIEKPFAIDKLIKKIKRYDLSFRPGK